RAHATHRGGAVRVRRVRPTGGAPGGGWGGALPLAQRGAVPAGGRGRARAARPRPPPPPPLLAAGGDLDDGGHVLAGAHHAGHGYFLPDLARHPDLDDLRRRRAARLAAVALALEPLLEAVPAAGVTRHLAALPVAAVHAAADHAGDRLARPVRLHDGALLTDRDAHAHAADDFLDLGHHAANRDGAAADLGGAFAAVGRERFLAPLG